MAQSVVRAQDLLLWLNLYSWGYYSIRLNLIIVCIVTNGGQSSGMVVSFGLDQLTFWLYYIFWFYYENWADQVCWFNRALLGLLGILALFASMVVSRYLDLFALQVVSHTLALNHTINN